MSSAVLTSSVQQVVVNGHKSRSRSSISRASLSSSSQSRDSSQDACSNCSSASSSAVLVDSPSKESISEALDKYISASKDGREAFSRGNIYEAMKDFDQALDIELQTELDCLYDTSIGMVSGLVRREVDSRLGRQGKFTGNSESVNARCSKILHQLHSAYQDAASGVKGKKSDSPQWYLQMGAALVVINEWDKAKAVYADGISICKDKKELKHALKNLIKIDQMTSYGEIPAEDQPDNRRDSLSAVTAQSPSHKANLSPTHRTQSSGSSPTHRGLQVAPAHSPQLTKRHRSGSANVQLAKIRKDSKRERSGSLNLDNRDTTSAQAAATLRTSYSPPVTKRDSKRLSLGFLRSSSGFAYSLGKNKSRTPSLTSPEEVELWSNCFQPASCPIFSYTEYQPSAITHMRRLTSVDTEPAEDELNVDAQEGNTHRHSLAFTAVLRPSMKIDDDDSDLDD